jgi:hypothetical protein
VGVAGSLRATRRPWNQRESRTFSVRCNISWVVLDFVHASPSEAMSAANERSRTSIVSKGKIIADVHPYALAAVVSIGVGRYLPW